MRQRRHNIGFTLIELVLVLMLLTILTSYAVPRLQGWSEGSRMHDVTHQFLSAARYARTQAIATSTTLTLTVSGSSFTLTDADGQTLPGEFASATNLPDAFSIRIDQGGAGNNTIRFTSNGATTPAVVVISSNTGSERRVICNAPAETFQVEGEP